MMIFITNVQIKYTTIAHRRKGVNGIMLFKVFHNMRSGMSISRWTVGS